MCKGSARFSLVSWRCDPSSAITRHQQRVSASARTVTAGAFQCASTACLCEYKYYHLLLLVLLCVITSDYKDLHHRPCSLLLQLLLPAKTTATSTCTAACACGSSPAAAGASTSLGSSPAAAGASTSLDAVADTATSLSCASCPLTSSCVPTLVSCFQRIHHSAAHTARKQTLASACLHVCVCVCA